MDYLHSQEDVLPNAIEYIYQSSASEYTTAYVIKLLLDDYIKLAKALERLGIEV